MSDLKTFFRDGYSGTWIGKVLTVDDPERLGRIKASIFGLWSEEIPVENLPWILCGDMKTGGDSTGSGSFSLPKINELVTIRFDNENPYYPEWFYSTRLSDALIEWLKSLDLQRYQRAKSLIFDTDGEQPVRITYEPEEGLMILWGNNTINLKHDEGIYIKSNTTELQILNDKTVTINCENATIKASKKTIINSEKIELGEGSTEPIILGESFKKFFESHTHGTPLGPSTPPVAPFPPNLLSKITTSK